MIENNRKDTDELISKLNKSGDTVFARHALNKNKVMAIFHNDQDMDTIYFDMEYIKNTSLDITTTNYNNREFLEELKLVMTIVDCIRKLEINNEEIGCPDYYHNFYNQDDEYVKSTFGWNLQDKYEKKKDIK